MIEAVGKGDEGCDLKQDVLCEIARLKEEREEIRRDPPHCFCSAIVYGSKIRAVEEELQEWEALARAEKWIPEVNDPSGGERAAGVGAACADGEKDSGGSGIMRLVKSALYMFRRILLK